MMGWQKITAIIEDITPPEYDLRSHGPAPPRCPAWSWSPHSLSEAARVRHSEAAESRSPQV